MAAASFYFDLGSPYAYLASERIEELLPSEVIWRPVLLGGLFRLTGRRSWALVESSRRQAGMAEIERRARAYGLPALRWPDPWPTDYLLAMRAATYAFSAGRGPQFARQAFRRAFRDGLDLGVAANVIRVGQEAGLEPKRVAAAAQDPEIKARLRAATDEAYALGVSGVPTIALNGETFWGDDRLEEAAAYLAAIRR